MPNQKSKGKSKSSKVDKQKYDNKGENQRELGINLSSLSDAQKKMCVKLLAQGNVEFKEKNNTYVATLKVPNSQLKEFSEKNLQSNEKNIRAQSGKKCAVNKQNENENRQKENRKRQKVYQNGKKPLRKAVKLENIDKIQKFHPQVGIYIYPKRLSFQILIQFIENMYQAYWDQNENYQRSSINSKNGKKANHNLAQNFENCSFHKIFYEMACATNNMLNKSKNTHHKVDQFLVNLLDSIYHFQFKSLGVKIFSTLLTQNIANDYLSFFFILRGLLEGIIGQPILDDKNVYKHSSIHKRSSNTSIYTTQTAFFNYPISKLKWNPYEEQLSQPEAAQFLKLCLPNNKQFDDNFIRLTEIMHYDQKKKGNFIQVFQLMSFILADFNQSISGEQLTHLELSYSGDSTLHDILFSSLSHEQVNSQPLQLEYESQMKIITPQIAQQFVQRNTNFSEDLRIGIIDKCHHIVQKMGIPYQIYDEKIEPIVLKCLEALEKSDKALWIDSVELSGNQAQLLYIQNVQKQYQQFIQQLNSGNMLNYFTKKIIYGPGVMNLFMKHVKL